MAGAERKMLEKVTTTARELETLPRLQARARSARGSSFSRPLELEKLGKCSSHDPS